MPWLLTTEQADQTFQPPTLSCLQTPNPLSHLRSLYSWRDSGPLVVLIKGTILVLDGSICFFCFQTAPINPDLIPWTQMSTCVDRMCVWKASVHRILRPETPLTSPCCPVSVWYLRIVPQLPGTRQKKLKSLLDQ